MATKLTIKTGGKASLPVLRMTMKPQKPNTVMNPRFVNPRAVASKPAAKKSA